MSIPVLSRRQFVLLELLAADPATPTNGQAWYNNATSKFRAREGGVTKDMIGSGGGGGITIDEVRREAVLFGAY